MRGALLMAMLGLACGGSKPMSTHRDAQLAPSPGDSAMTAVADLAPANDPGGDPAADASADAWLAGDDGAKTEISSGCTMLPITELPSPSAIVCPPAATEACGFQDQGPIFVARSWECMGSWGAVSFQCQMWPELKPDQEFVIVPVPSCADRIWVESALRCEDRVEIAFVNQGLCACGANTANLRLFAIPLDPRPVVATVTFQPRPPCLPP